MKQLRIGVWAGIFVSVFSLFLLIKSFSFSYKSEFGPGPGFFPVWLCGILFVLSLLYIYESAKREQDSDEKLPTGHALKNVLFILTCLILFVIFVSYLGFILTGTLFLFILLFRQYRWYISIGISLSVSVFIFWLFSSVLGVILPHGLIAF
jgi:putative tricarboxylic transport membrane protein